jgi:archaemetzincin
MKLLRLVRVGEVEDDHLVFLSDTLSSGLGIPTPIDDRTLDPSFAFHPERGQHHATEILTRLADLGETACSLGVTGVDLFIPILTYIFGQAESGGHRALVSIHRLSQEFYGLPPDEEILRTRLFKESLHEIGHLLSLHHCDDYECVMASSHAVEWVDLKQEGFCPRCLDRVRNGMAAMPDSSLDLAARSL